MLQTVLFLSLKNFKVLQSLPRSHANRLFCNPFINANSKKRSSWVRDKRFACLCYRKQCELHVGLVSCFLSSVMLCCSTDMDMVTALINVISEITQLREFCL